MKKPLDYISSLEDANISYGGKANGLAIMIQAGVSVPNGFALSPEYVNLLTAQNNDNEFLSSLKTIINKSNTSFWAVRSSALCEDGDQYSFAGIYETVLHVPNNINDIQSAINQIKNSENSERAQSYQTDINQKEKQKNKFAIVIQEMVDPHISGVAFSKAIDENGQNSILIEYVEGTGEKLVSGRVIPTRMIIPLTTKGEPVFNYTRIFGTPLEIKNINKLVKQILLIENTIGKPIDIEWGMTKEGIIWLLQARPITKTIFISNVSSCNGVSASPGNTKNETFVINSDKDLKKFPNNAVLIAQVTETNYLPAMKKASAIVTEEGGILSHAAIVARELSIPCIVGKTGACTDFPTGTNVHVNGSEASIYKVGTESDISTQISDIDWGAMYCFDGLMPFTFEDNIVLFEATPNGMALHVKENLPIENKERIEIFSRKTFSAYPKYYQSDKYLWYFEWNNFIKNPFFVHHLKLSQEIIKGFDAKEIDEFYNKLIQKGVEIVELKKIESNAAKRFLMEETLLSIHFLLTMVIPEGYALRHLYIESMPLLDIIGVTFSSFLAQNYNKVILSTALIKLSNFSQAVAIRRNTIYKDLVNVEIMHDNYFDDREYRLKKALKSINTKVSDKNCNLTYFYDNMHDVPK